MPYRTIKIEESDYHHLKVLAAHQGISVEDMLSKIVQKQRVVDKEMVGETELKHEVHSKKSRWAEMSNRIRKDPPLRGAGDCVRESMKEFREDFSFKYEAE